jgi:hypothetical protein
MTKFLKEKRMKKILWNPKNSLTRMTKNLKKKRMILWNQKRSLTKTTKNLKREKTKKKL